MYHYSWIICYQNTVKLPMKMILKSEHFYLHSFVNIMHIHPQDISCKLLDITTCHTFQDLFLLDYPWIVDSLYPSVKRYCINRQRSECLGFNVRMNPVGLFNDLASGLTTWTLLQIKCYSLIVLNSVLVFHTVYQNKSMIM